MTGSLPSNQQTGQTFRGNLVRFAALSWGLCAFFPIGVAYLNLVLLICALAFAGDFSHRFKTLRRHPLFMPILLMLAWSLLAASVGDWFPDTSTRIFHICRVVLVLGLGLMLTAEEAYGALLGLLASSVLAAILVAAHHVWGMPDWAIWSGLLSSRNNFSSANMIMMAMASGVFFLLGIRAGAVGSERWLTLAAALALGVTVSLHAVSRNSQMLLVVLLMTALVYRFRSLRAILGGLATMVVLAAAMWQLSPTTQSRFNEMFINLETADLESNYASSVGVRWRMYQEASQAMAENPLFGTGLGSWLPHWQAVWHHMEKDLAPEARHAWYADINNPHNDFLLAGMETGVAGMLLLIWLLASYVRAGWRRQSMAGGVTVVMAVAIFATALINAPFRDAAFGMTLLWLLSVSVAAHSGTPRE